MTQRVSVDSSGVQGNDGSDQPSVSADRLLRQQSELDILKLGCVLRREFGAGEREQLFGAILEAKRWTFVRSGVTHPRFDELFIEVTTPAQRERVTQALAGLVRVPQLDC